jgi:type IV pilus assembly protein PilB
MSFGKLGDMLVENGRITAEQLSVAVGKQNGTHRFLGEILIEMGFLTDVDLAKTLAEQLGMDYYDLGEDFRLDKEEIKFIPENVARRFCLVPVRKNDSPLLTVIMRDPLDLEAVDVVRSLTPLEIRKAISTPARIMAVINKFYRAEAHIEQNLQDILDLEKEESRPEVHGSSLETNVDADQMRLHANDAPVVRFVNLLLLQAVRDRASDIHFEPGETTVTVRLRIDGVLREVTPPPKAIYQAVVTRIKILSNMDIAEKRLPLDGRFKYVAQGRVIDVRVSSLPEVYGEKLVLRILDRESLVVDMRSVGIEEPELSRFQQVLRVPHGIILLTGPTGSGKTTTLYAALSHLKNPELNIQTVEDPVEYLVGGINQMQIKPAIHLDFANALRAILRQDPDIIMIGEIRDLETARIAMQASLTGHLVLSTLHTNDSPAAFVRLRDIGVESYLIAATMQLVIAQRLIRKICPECAHESRPTPDEVVIASRCFPDAATWKYFRGKGCQKCGKTGYRGRTAIIEFLEVTDPIRELIQVGAGTVQLRQKAIDLGMEPLLKNGIGKVKRGVSTVEEILTVCPITELVA